MRFHIMSCLVGFYLTFMPVVFNTADASQNVTKKVEAVIQSYHQYGVFNGSVLIAKDNQVIYEHGVGFADINKNLPNTPNTPFRIGSLSKTFTALLIMQLMEQKKLKLSDFVHKILPEYTSAEGQKITIRHLLAHTSGLPGHFQLPGWKEGKYQNNFSRSEWLQTISQLTLLSEPGEQYHYGNLNYFLLGCIIEKLSGMSYQTNLHKRIFQPSNMHSSGVEDAAMDPTIPTVGYRIGASVGFEVQSTLNMQVFFAGANIYSTVVDLFNFEQALFSGKLLKQHTLDFWLNTKQSFAWQKGQLDLSDNKSLDWLSYNGQLQGFSSMLSVLGDARNEAQHPTTRFTVIILSNNGINYWHKQQLVSDLYAVLAGQHKNMNVVESPLPITFMLTKAALDGTLEQQVNYLITHADEFVVKEHEIDSLAQQLFWASANHKAAAVWQLNSQLFPDSDNARNMLKALCENQTSLDGSVEFCRKHRETSSSIETRKGTLIRNISIVSPELSEPLDNHDVYIVDDKIVSIGKDLQVKANQVINGTDQFLTPGLIDAHTHLSGVPGMSYEHSQAYPKIVKEATEQIPRSYLYHGFTTVIDLHSDPRNIANWNQREIRPQAYFCGAAPVVDGYPMSFVPKPFRYQLTPYFLLDGEYVPPGVDPLQHTPEAVVEKMRAAGASCVKTHYESGFGGKGNLPTPSLKLIRDLKTAANAAQLPLLLHANSQEAQRFGINAGVDVFAHSMWTWNDPTESAIHGDIRNILDSAIAKNIVLQPTIQVLYGERDLFDPTYLETTDLAKVLPRSLINWYKTPEGQSFRHRLAKVDYVKHILRSDTWDNIGKIPIQRAMSILIYMMKNGGTLSFGSDTPSDLTFANPPGLNGRYEMKRWQQAGVTGKQFLEAATTTNAKLFNLDNLIGSVQVTKRADLLILGKNPLIDIDAFDSIVTVISAGKVLPRESLAANR
ncbi:MAG: serine hydrolase [Paraglaciecola sp.]|uniref:serine hydrolase n=1 Tax=Paraglaciecola sp. TaxID=1920173 RepID=UPI003297125F